MRLKPMVSDYFPLQVGRILIHDYLILRVFRLDCSGFVQTVETRTNKTSDMTTRLLGTTFLTILLFTTFSSSSAQSASEAQAKALTRWLTLDAPPGWEHLATDVLMKAMAGWQRDALGN